MPSVLVAGLDARSLLLEAPLVKREGHAVEQYGSARELMAALEDRSPRLVVLGADLGDLSLPDAVRRIRGSGATRQVSVLALVTAATPFDVDARALQAGANAVLRRPLDRHRLEGWVAKLLAVPRRVQARLAVQGEVVATPRRADGGGHFFALTRNLSVHGLLLASPVPLLRGSDLELEMTLPEVGRLRAIGRVVREASEVAWPYRGYGVELLFVPPEVRRALERLVTQQASAVPAALAGPVRFTVRRDTWVYDVLEPVSADGRWQVEIRRSPREAWRPGEGGPFYVVASDSAEGAVAEARAFLHRHG